MAFWDQLAARVEKWDLSGYYHHRIKELYSHLIAPGQSVIEFGSGSGDLLAAVEPSRGVGIDLSSEMTGIAATRHDQLSFVRADIHEWNAGETFDAVIMSDLVNDLWDVQAAFSKVRRLCAPETRVVLNFYNKLWQIPLSFARLIRVAKPLKRQNWLSEADVKNLLRMSGFEVVSETSEILFPLRIPLITGFLNRFLVKLWPFNHLGMTQFLVARPRLPYQPARTQEEKTVSVVIPARNEAGHIREIIERTPSIGKTTELIFVEGNSTDDTYAEIERAISDSPNPNIRLFRQPGVGKGDAVRFGFKHAEGEVLMILDADMTVAPEELPRFYEAIADGSGEFINGVRLVYPMENDAMRFFNYLGNRLFGIVFSWILRQPVKDTLCGTKVLSRASYDSIASNRSYFGDFDPFGDFDLLFGAARLNLKIMDMPIRYRERRYGTTNIDRWRHGWLLLKMASFAARRLRFI